jgi:hypothetical protein
MEIFVYELIQFNRLREDDPLRSPSGLYALHYDADGVAVLTDLGTGEVRWRAGDDGRPAAGLLLLGNGDAVQVETPEEHRTVWCSRIAAPGARSLVVTDAGDLELLSTEGVRLLNSRTGPVEATAVADAAPAADITDERYLVREGKWRRFVTRDRNGSLRVSTRSWGGGWSFTLPARLARWMERDGTVLTWRLLPDRGRRTAWSLCLTGPDGEVIWREGMRDLPVLLPPAAPHAYGGPTLGRGGRLRHQSLTSASGSHTLVHQDDGNLVLYCNPAHRAVWTTDTWWAGDGWAELTDDGDLVVRNICGALVWRLGAAGSGAQRLVVNDDGSIALLDAAGSAVWDFRTHAPCAEPGMNTARGSVLRRGQTLQRQSLTSADGGTVLAHRDDRRLVLFNDDGSWLWDEYIWKAERTCLVLDDDGVLRARADNGTVALELGGPADELVVVPGEVQLRRGDGTVVWRNGVRVAESEAGAPPVEDFESWLDALMQEQAYCVTVVRDVQPDEALRRLGARPEQVSTGTWQDLLAQAAREEADFNDVVVAAFALGPHTLLVEENGWQGIGSPQLSEGTFAVSCYRSINADSSFVLFRDGDEVADHSWDNGSPEPTTSEVEQALAAMGCEDPIDTAFEHDLELLCRTASVRPTVADVTGLARIALITGR